MPINFDRNYLFTFLFEEYKHLAYANIFHECTVIDFFLERKRTKIKRNGKRKGEKERDTERKRGQIKHEEKQNDEG
jgi:hypothetical protein